MSEDSLSDRFAARMGALLGPDFPSDIALAVSGGGDSMAMLALAHGWARPMGVRIWVVTVDHGLRPESAGEAAMVAAECAALGHPHATLRWHWDGQGNLQDAARRGRLALIDRWRGGIGHVLFAHTQDDVAETFLMRLARGSGVEGLSAMADRRLVRPHPGAPAPLAAEDVTRTATPPDRPRPVGDMPEDGAGFHVIRPLLGEARAELRHYADTLKVPYVDDPSNDDPRFDRARARAALAGLGIGGAEIAATATRLARAREALEARAASVAQEVVESEAIGVLRIVRDAFARVERDTQLRLLAAALQWVGGSEYRPRAAPLEALLDRALAGGGGTLSGAQLAVTREHLEIFREYAAVAGHEVPTGPAQLWDGRWMVHGPEIAGLTLRALGDDGWSQLPEGARATLRHAIARTMPAVFGGPDLVACPPLGHGSTAVAEFRPPLGRFVASLKSR
ncbi:tRNA lysidine(34) synthetase TilS [Roseibacterium sp. SDUM158016]|uniref:tRNA lysidine(34) synthetase TilS n=1 Tax=Roseicyclus sediminis TaxID=2980997 RepID=UPI0021D07A4C|nr:tRNA lysidine(34) synthetase TilS [Roseibacterium sp. SDUM158016]MCU4654482.1 tRNA lysidine(34) synthetase TilS [Roseibacterium sp. SDUM158016]